MKKLTQLHVDVSAYLFAMTLTVIFCFFAAAMCYVEMCAKDILLTSDGRLYEWMNAVIDFIDGYL